jgi:putative transposase
LTQAINRYKIEQKESLSSLTRLLGINRQVYYRSIKININTRKLIEKVLAMVREVRLQMPRIGTRKLFYLLLDKLKPLKVGRDRLFSILKANNLLISPKRSYHITTDSNHHFKKHKNLIENSTPNRPEQIWVSDITYIGNRKNPMYLSLVTDAYSKKIVGYNVSNTLETKASLEALKMAIKGRIYKAESLIHHSDRGLQYCSRDYQKLLIKNAITCSMTESYDPYANAIAERVNGILKQEFIGYDRNINISMMSELVKNSVKIYNQVRPHYSCHFKTPQIMHMQSQIKIKTYKKENPVGSSQLDSLN